jgi:hypothetical protein
MPAALVHTVVNHFFILIGRRGYFSTMPLLITKQASGNDVVLLRRSAILMSLKMFASALEALSLAKRYLVL